MNEFLGSAAALVSVGGSPAPVLHVLREHQPAHVWYFCSTDSRAKADEIQAALDWHPQARFIEVERFEELGPCYRELRRKIPEILSETKVNPREVLVDYTGGTKTMSAALILATTEWFDRFSYVGGEQRERGGLGITIDGKERVRYQTNPWSDLAIREIERAQDLWAGCQFETAERVLRSVVPRVPNPRRFESVANVADAMAARHRLDFKEAVRGLGPVQKTLPSLFDGHNNHGFINFTSECLEVCVACSKDTASKEFLRELLDNTLRTAGQNRFEDAAARLYRAMEMQGQLWLTEATEGLFINGRCKPENIGKIPVQLQRLEFWKSDREGECIDLSLEQAFWALHALGDKRVDKVIEDIKTSNVNRKILSRWRQATEKRNTSILAHGVSPVGEEGFTQMKQIATEFLGFELQREANPVKPLDPRWLIAAT